MPYRRPISLRVAKRKDFSSLLWSLLFLATVSAVLSPYPVLLVLLTASIFGAGQLIYILGFSKLNELNFISIIFPDGQVRIRSNDEFEIVGFLSGQQWCTSHAAVLRYKTKVGFKRMVLLSWRQNAHDYRRLRVSLNHGFVDTLFSKSEGRV